MKTCAHCHVEKLVSEYYESVPYVCKPCHNNRGKAWAKANPDIRRERNWKNKYGIQMTMVQYEQMYELQAGLCQVCGRKEPSGRTLAVDHDHETGVIRGLLCTKCNTTLGWYDRYRSSFEKYRKE